MLFHVTNKSPPEALISLGDGINSIDNSRDVPKKGQQKTDPEFNLATKLEEDTKGRQDDGQDDVYAVGCGLV